LYINRWMRIEYACAYPPPLADRQERGRGEERRGRRKRKG